MAFKKLSSRMFPRLKWRMVVFFLMAGVAVATGVMLLADAVIYMTRYIEHKSKWNAVYSMVFIVWAMAMVPFYKAWARDTFARWKREDESKAY